MKFKVGDKVRYTSPTTSALNVIGRIVDIDINSYKGEITFYLYRIQAEPVNIFRWYSETNLELLAAPDLIFKELLEK